MKDAIIFEDAEYFCKENHYNINYVKPKFINKTIKHL
jgi:hypothetical protein